MDPEMEDIRKNIKIKATETSSHVNKIIVITTRIIKSILTEIRTSEEMIIIMAATIFIKMIASIACNSVKNLSPIPIFLINTKILTKNKIKIPKTRPH